MKFKHSLLLILLIILALFSVNAAVADGFFGFGESDDNIVSICGVEYNIPEGFHENVNSSINNESLNDGGFAYYLTSKQYSNAKDIFTVGVSHYTLEITNKTLEKLGGEPRNIDGHDGYFKNIKDGCEFNYIVNGDIVSVSATNEDLLTKVIV